MEFRKAQRNTEQEYEIKNIEDIDKSNAIDHILFGKLVNRKNRKPTGLHPLKRKDGTVISNPEDILNAWKECFSHLHTPNDRPEYDNDFKAMVVEQLKLMEKDANMMVDDIMWDDITIDQIMKAKSLMNVNCTEQGNNVNCNYITAFLHSERWGVQNLYLVEDQFCKNLLSHQLIARQYMNC